MDTIFIRKELQKNKISEGRLSYLSKTLATALTELEKSQSKLQDFVLENNAIPEEVFVEGSIELNSLRGRLSKTKQLILALNELITMLDKKNLTQNDYNLLSQKYPVVDQIEFRRILGQSATINSWTWPDQNTVKEVANTLISRKRILESKLEISQINADRSGSALEAYAGLERNLLMHEATYQVLIEQAKAESLLSGYKPETSEVYEYATASINPSEPNRNLIILYGALVGVIIGCLAAFLLSRSKKTFYSGKSLVTAAEPFFHDRLKPLVYLRKKSLLEIKLTLNKKSKIILANLISEIHKNDLKQVVVTSLNKKFFSNEFARIVSSQISSNDCSTAIVNFTLHNNNKKSKTNSGLSEDYLEIEKGENVTIFEPINRDHAINLINRGRFIDSLQPFILNFDILFICVDSDEIETIPRALKGQKAFHINIAMLKQTRVDNLFAIKSHLPIQGLFYD